MEKHGWRRSTRIATMAFLLVLASCAGQLPPPTAEFRRFQEFERHVHVEEAAKTPQPIQAQPSAQLPSQKHATTVRASTVAAVARTSVRKPSSEGRASALLNPSFREGEVATLAVKFIGTSAGELILSTQPHAQVNKRSAFNFQAEVRSNALFSLFFRINDRINVFIDQERFIPLTYTMTLDESSKRQETRVHFDWESLRAQEWERTQERDSPLKERHKQWSLAPGAQCLMSVLYYLRAHLLEPGLHLRIPVSHDEKNFFISAEVLRREILETPLGPLKTLVVRTSDSFTEFLSQAKGPTLLWLTDDESRIPAQLEAPLKWGRLTAQIKHLTR